MIKPIQKRSVSQQIIDSLIESIESGQLKIGDKLPAERDFAQQLGVSRVPLREAICALSAMGILDVRHGDGTFVSAYSPNVMGRILRTYSLLDRSLADEIFEARILAEGEAARLAARNATPDDLDKISRDLDLFDQAADLYQSGKINLAEMLELDELVHLGFAVAAHNNFYIQFVNIIHRAGADQGLFEKAYTAKRDRYLDSIRFHRQIFAAIAAGDEQLAYETMCAHIENIRGAVNVKKQNARH